MASKFTFNQPSSLIAPGQPLEHFSIHQKKRRIRKFEPGTRQRERFALSKQAVMAHRMSSKSDVATVQLASPNPIGASGTSIRLKKSLKKLGSQLEGLSWGQKMEVLFPAAIAKSGPPTRVPAANARLYSEAVAAGLVKSSTEFWTKVKASGLDPATWIERTRNRTVNITSPLVRTIFEKGGASSQEMMADRVSPFRLEEILKTYLRQEDVKVYSGEKSLLKAMRAAGASSQQAEETLVSRRFRKVGGKSMMETPFVGGKGIFVASSEQLHRRWKEVFGEELSDVEKRKLLITAHESTEHLLQLTKGKKEGRIASHRDISIYPADIEFAAKLDIESVSQHLRRHELELPGVVKQVKQWTDPKRSALAQRSLSELPGTYKKILLSHGYSPSKVSSLIAPVENALLSRATKPSPEIAKPARLPPVSTRPIESATRSKFLSKYGQYDITPGYAAGKSSFAQWQRSGLIPKGSTLWAYEDLGFESTLKGFYLRFGKEEHIVDFSKKNASRLLKDLELKVALGVGDTQTATAIQEDIAIRGAQSRIATTKELQSIGNRAATDSPAGRRIKQTARRTLESIEAKGAQKVAEFRLPAVLEDYVSQGIKRVQEHNQLGPLRRAAPYAVGVAIGADVLASRDKTGPFWSLIAGVAGAFLGKKSIGRLAGFSAGYGLTRLITGSLEKLHDGSISGLGELGESSIGRKQLTDFGSGYRGLQKTLDVLADTFAGLKKSFKTAVGGQAVKVEAGENFVAKWYEIYQAAQVRGEAQELIQQRLRDQGVWEKLLPQVKQDPYTYRGIRKKVNPLMEFKKEDVNKALLDYAKEKGIKTSPNFWEASVAQSASPPILAPVNTAATESISIGLNKSSDIGTLPTLAHSPKDISSSKTMMASTLTPEDIRLEEVSKNLGLSGFNVNQLELANTINAGGSRPRSINESFLASQSPVPAFHKSVNPFEETLIPGARGTTHIGTAATLSPDQVDRSISKFERSYSDFAYAQTQGALRGRSHPKVLEGFKDLGLAETLRLENTDFGTGWDPARRLAKALFGKAVREGAEQIARGKAFKEILRSTKFQEALAQGTVVKELGQGGVGSVQLMETVIGEGAEATKFRYARKQYFSEGERAESLLAGESRGLRAAQSTISPTPYGKGKIAREGREIPVMYFEAIEDAIPAGEAFAQQGGVTRAQKKSLLDAVKKLHEKGLYHSDIKPANMLVDKEGRLVLIDPMPGRYEMKELDKTLTRKLGQAQDLMATEIISSGGNPSVVRGRLNVLSNAITETMRVGMGAEPGKYYEMALQMAQSAFRRAGASSIAEQYGIPMLPFSLSSGVSKNLSVGSAKASTAATGADSPMARAKKARKAQLEEGRATRAQGKRAETMATAAQVPKAKATAAARPKALLHRAQPNPFDEVANAFGEGRDAVAQRVAGRELLHKQAVRTAAENNRNPARRHRTMSQTNPFS